MLILALDSAALSGSVALCEDGVLIAECTVCTGHTHSETLLPMVEAVLRAAGRQVGDIGLFACTVGPGSFTGVRIGAATVKGLAFGRGVPCIGVSTPEALAENGVQLAAATGGLLCPVMNARREQVFNALFEVRDGQACRLCADRALPMVELGHGLAEDPAYAGRPVLLTGDGAAMTAQVLAGILPAECVICLPERDSRVSAYHVAQCALRAYRAGVRTTDAELTPVYLRMSQAERTRTEKLAQNAPESERNELASMKTEKIIIGCDHGGLNLKNAVIAHLQAAGVSVEDVGTYTADSCNYPEYADRVCRRIQDGTYTLGILICGTGIGMSMAANKHAGIRAAACENTFSARMTRMHNNANVLCMGERVIGPGLACDMVDLFISTDFAGGRHEARVAMLDALDGQRAEGSNP